MKKYSNNTIWLLNDDNTRLELIDDYGRKYLGLKIKYVKK